MDCEEHRNFTWFPGVDILQKGTVCGNCVFQQNFYTRKLGETTVFFAVLDRLIIFHKSVFKPLITWNCLKSFEGVIWFSQNVRSRNFCIMWKFYTVSYWRLSNVPSWESSYPSLKEPLYKNLSLLYKDRGKQQLMKDNPFSFFQYSHFFGYYAHFW